MWVWCWVCYFFFKQKMAYEMRISGWSSDVCASDLGLQALYELDMSYRSSARFETDRRYWAALTTDMHEPVRLTERRASQSMPQRMVTRTMDPARDRKSVVKRKRVSVRVDLGVRRIIKEKQPTIHPYVYSTTN